MRVMLVTGSFPPLHCGVGDYSGRLAEALACLPGTTVDVVTSPGAASVGLSPGIYVAEPFKSWSATNARQFLRLVRRLAPDVVHIQYPTQGYGSGMLPDIAPLLARRAGAAVVLTCHEPIGTRAILRLGLRLAANPDVVVVRSDFRARLPLLTRLLMRFKAVEYVMGGSAIPFVRLTKLARDELRDSYKNGQPRLIVFFGFIYPHKGVDLVFDIADPGTDHIVVAGDLATDPAYSRVLQRLAGGAWRGKVTFTGFLSPTEASSLLAAADALVLPFRDGGGDWNSSLLAARAHGTYTVTTSKRPTGFDADTNTFFAPVDDVASMKNALKAGGKPYAPSAISAQSGDWQEVASKHLRIYERALERSRTTRSSPA